jgi:beta-phosphoglucomutase
VRTKRKSFARRYLMNKLNAVIFDLDGVICFTDKYHFQAWKKLADEEGIYFDEEINDRLRGVSRMDSLDIILERAFREYTQEEKTQMAARKNESYVHLLDQMSPADLSVEVKDTLDELRKRGYKLAIGSSSKNTKKILKQIGLGDYFDAISDGTNITKSKPDPEVFLKAAEMLGEKPENCIRFFLLSAYSKLSLTDAFPLQFLSDWHFYSHC